MDPLVTSAAIGAGASLAGGLLGGSKQKIDYRGAKKGIRWRVRDAKAAGIHPLFAMGAPGVGSGQILSESNNSMAAGLADAGQHAAKYFDQKAKRPSPRDKALMEHNTLQAARRNEAEADRARTEANMVELQYHDALAAKSGQQNQHAELEDIPFAMRPVRDPFSGETYLIPNQEVGIELPETYGAWELMAPPNYFNRTNPDKWHPDVMRGYK